MGYVCVCVRERERQPASQTDRQRGREKERERESLGWPVVTSQRRISPSKSISHYLLEYVSYRKVIP